MILEPVQNFYFANSNNNSVYDLSIVHERLYYIRNFHGYTVLLARQAHFQIDIHSNYYYATIHYYFIK